MFDTFTAFVRGARHAANAHFSAVVERSSYVVQRLLLQRYD